MLPSSLQGLATRWLANLPGREFHPLDYAPLPGRTTDATPSPPFNVIDDFNRECLTVEIDTSLTGKRLIRVFERLQQERGLPDVLRTDNGPEFLSGDFVAWAEAAGMMIHYIQPGEPNQNAYIERFNRTYREEVLSVYLFQSLREVRETTYWWMTDYNDVRPHDALGDLTPSDFMTRYTRNSTFVMST